MNYGNLFVTVLLNWTDYVCWTLFRMPQLHILQLLSQHFWFQCTIKHEYFTLTVEFILSVVAQDLSNFRSLSTVLFEKFADISRGVVR